MRMFDRSQRFPDDHDQPNESYEPLIALNLEIKREQDFGHIY